MSADSNAHTFSPLLRTLSSIPGLSGHEDAIARHMADALAATADEVTIDSLGNVIARFGAAGQPSIALLAHMDTIGFLVNRVYGNGMLGVVPVGGANFKALPGAPVRVGDLPGVIGVRSQHQARESDTLAAANSLYIDLGQPGAVEITTPVVYAAQPIDLPGGYFSSPYMDNRAGCAVLLEVARRLPRPTDRTVYLIGTVQEETNSQGAYHALQAVQPSAAIFIDGTVSHDTPDTAALGQMALGGGPVLTAYLYTRDIGRVHRMSEGLDFGMIGINAPTVGAASTPFGGMKQSGIGREGGKWGVEEFTELKYVLLAGVE